MGVQTAPWKLQGNTGPTMSKAWQIIRILRTHTIVLGFLSCSIISCAAKVFSNHLRPFEAKGKSSKSQASVT